MSDPNHLDGSARLAEPPPKPAVGSTPRVQLGTGSHARVDVSANRPVLLNAFRHHRMLRVASAHSILVLSACSTPFGITGCYATESKVPENPDTLCSTPFGITGCYAYACTPTSSDCPCAQRLSASQDATLSSLIHRRPLNQCSTPFGITGCYAFCWEHAVGYAVCSTPFGITGCYARRPDRY